VTRGDDRLDAGRRHATHYLALAEDADRHSGGAQAPWLSRLVREQDNIRAALGWARHHDPALGVRLAGAMGWYWRLRGSYAEGREWLHWAASTMDTPVPGVLIGLGMLEYLQCEYDRASSRLRQALDLCDPAAEPRVVARASQVLGSIAREQGRYADARARHEESLAIWRRLDDQVGVTRSVKALGFTAWLEEDYRQYQELAALLGAEIGTGPAPETAALYARLQRPPA
jgi:tetratricopeptide (TPR) repeat protein